MLVRLRSILVDAQGGQALCVALADLGVSVVSCHADLAPLPPLLGRPDAPQLLIVDLGTRPHETLQALSTLAQRFPATTFFATSASVDPTVLLMAMRCGIREVIPLPLEMSVLRGAIERVAATHRGRGGHLIHVIPTVGGAGASTIACNVAAILAATSKTLLLDMDLSRGNVAMSFDMRPRYTLADVMRHPDRIDAQLLQNAIAVHAPTGLSILARPEQPEDAAAVSPDGLAAALPILGQLFDYIVVDSILSFQGPWSVLLRQAQVQAIVVQLTIPSLRNAERLVSALRRQGVGPDRLRVIINRHAKRSAEIDVGEVERVLGMPAAWMVPNEFRPVMDAINLGKPAVLFSPRCTVSTSLRGLAALLADARESVAARSGL